MADNKPNHAETYHSGYDSTVTAKLHTSRTAEKQAAWFLPYLESGMALLDCGCATGSITVGLADAVAPGQVTGVDISDAEIKRAQARAFDAGIENIHFATGTIYQLDFPENHFDAVFSHNVLEHTAEPSRALQEMHRVLKPGGVIGIRDSNWGSNILAPADDLAERFFAIIGADWETVNGNPQIGRRLGALLAEVGFIDIKATASYENYSDLEDRRFVSQIIGKRLAEEEPVERVIKRGLTNAAELEAIKEAWANWQELPGAFCAIAHCEAVGWKA